MSGTNFFVAKISDHTQGAFTDENGLFLWVKCDTTPETQANVYAPGCFLVRTDNTTWYCMTGTSASPSWTVNGTGAVGPTGATGYTGYTGRTGYTGYTGYTG